MMRWLAPYRTALCAALAFCAALASAAGPTSASIDVDVELVLAVDVSDSIQPEEAQLQRDGYIEAITSPDTLAAIRQGELGRIAVTYMEWADAGNQKVIVDWEVIEDASSARAFADRLASQPIGTGFHTSLSAAIDVAVRLLERNDYAGTRRVIDISGDGQNNKGRPLSDARADAIARGITINGLPITGYSRMFKSRLPPFHIEEYYRDELIGGPAAFIVVAENFEDFERAIHRKLLKEIAGHAAPQTEELASADFDEDP